MKGWIKWVGLALLGFFAWLIPQIPSWLSPEFQRAFNSINSDAEHHAESRSIEKDAPLVKNYTLRPVAETKPVPKS